MRREGLRGISTHAYMGHIFFIETGQSPWKNLAHELTKSLVENYNGWFDVTILPDPAIIWLNKKSQLLV